MAGYPHGHGPPNYGYGPPPPTAQPYAPPYGAPPPSQPQPYAPASSSPYGAPSAPYAPSKPSKENKPSASGYPSAPSGYPPAQSGYPSAPSGYPPAQSGYPPAQSGYPPAQSGYPPAQSGYPPAQSGYPPAQSGYPPAQSGYPPAQSGYPPSGPPSYGSNPFGALVPSAFPPGTDPNVVACFQVADQDGSGFIDDKELQMALSSYNQSFSIRTVRLLMYLFTNSNARKIGPKEFTAVFYSLQNWRSIFERFDRDRSGKIDPSELKEALLSLGFAVSPMVLDLLISKFDKSGGRNHAIEYDNFIECCLTVKGLTEKFREKDTTFSGSATFNYESFMLTVLPFLIA